MRRTMRCGLLALGLVIVGIGPAEARPAAGPLKLQVTAADGSAPTTVVLEVAPGSTTGSARLNIANRGKKEVTFSLLADMAGLEPTVTPAELKIPAGKRRSVKVTVQGIDDLLEHTGSLLYDYDGSHVLIPLRVQRGSNVSDLQVADAPGGVFSRTIPGAHLDTSVTLRSASSKEVGAQVSFGDLSNGSGERTAVTARHAGEPLPDRVTFTGSYRIDLTADLPRSGAWTAPMEIRVGEDLLAITISVTRTPDVLSLAFTGTRSPSVKADRKGSTDVTFDVASATPVDLRLPIVTLQRGTPAAEDAPFTASVSVDGTPVGTDDSIHLDTNVSRRIQVRLTDLDPGWAYNGKVTFRANGLKETQETTFTFAVGHTSRFAMAWIILGVVLSLIVSSVLIRYKQQLATRMASVPFEEDLDRLVLRKPTGVDLDLIELLRARIADALLLDASRDETDAKLFDPISVRIRLLGRVIRVQEKREGRPPEEQKLIDQKLEVVRAFIESSGTDQAAADAAIDVADKVTSTSRDQQARVATLKATLDSYEALLGAPKVTAIENRLAAALRDDSSEAGVAAALARFEPEVIDLFADALHDQLTDHPPGGDTTPIEAVVQAIRDLRSSDSAGRISTADGLLERGFRMLIAAYIEQLDVASTPPEARRKLAAARELLPRDLVSARAAYEEARGIVAAQGPPTGPVTGLAGPGAAPTTAAEAPAVGHRRPVEPTEPRPPSRAEQMSRDVTALRIVTAVIIGLVSSIVGFELLYAGNAAWGSTKDIVAAFGWGLGLSGTTLAGVAAVGAKVTGKS